MELASLGSVSVISIMTAKRAVPTWVDWEGDGVMVYEMPFMAKPAGGARDKLAGGVSGLVSEAYALRTCSGGRGLLI
jgi:hypothetical protein